MCNKKKNPQPSRTFPALRSIKITWILVTKVVSVSEVPGWDPEVLLPTGTLHNYNEGGPDPIRRNISI